MRKKHKAEMDPSIHVLLSVKMKAYSKSFVIINHLSKDAICLKTDFYF
jgi:hypothetical protein